MLRVYDHCSVHQADTLAKVEKNSIAGNFHRSHEIPHYEDKIHYRLSLKIAEVGLLKIKMLLSNGNKGTRRFQSLRSLSGNYV